MKKSIAITFFRSIVTVACLSATAAFAAPALNLTHVRADDFTKPAAVPADYVVTPFGYFHPSCVQALGTSEQLREDGSVLRADGTVHHVKACTHAAFLRDGTRIEPNDEANRMVRQPSTYNGYLQLVSATIGSGAGKMTATMTVPGNPSSVSGQTVYFFPGLEDAQNVVSILQPVLGWNASGDNSWTIASWNCCINGQAWYGNFVTVKAGDRIFGAMVKVSSTAWTVYAKDLSQPSLPAATLKKTAIAGQTFDWIFAGALETYGVSSCSQFPSTGPIQFANIKTYAGGSLLSNLPWGVSSGSGSPSTCTSAWVVNSTTVDINY